MKKKDYLELRSIPPPHREMDEIEKQIKELFRKEIYYPLLKEFGEAQKTIKNASDALWEALRTGRITFSRGTFSGKFSASTSKELRAAGAKWDAKTKAWKLSRAEMPIELKNLVSTTAHMFEERIQAVDKKLAAVLPAEIAEKLKLEELFDTTIYKVNREFQANVKGITIVPELTPEMRTKIADEWQNNMRLWIKDFTEEHIKQLRAEMQVTVFAGNRFQSAIKTIQKSYGVSANKAKFLARQETKLLTAKFQEARYADAGIKEYTWHNVAGTPLHPVRPAHKALGDASKKGKIFSFDDPPNTAEPNEPARYNNPGEDFNCRCYSRPIIRFKK